MRYLGGKMHVTHLTLTDEAREMVKLLLILGALLLTFVAIDLISPGPEAWPARLQSTGHQANTHYYPGQR